MIRGWTHPSQDEFVSTTKDYRAKGGVFFPLYPQIKGRGFLVLWPHMDIDCSRLIKISEVVRHPS